MSFISRRAFLHQSLTAFATALASPQTLQAAAASAATMPQPCAPAAWHKHGIVLEPTEDWEGGQIENFTSPPEPLSDDRWRLWYSACGRKYLIAYAEGTPGSPFKKVPAQCTPGEPADGPFTLGHLPNNWNPVQVVHIHLRNGRHRIYFWAHGKGIARYLAADSDDGKRYTVINPLRPVLYHPSDRAAHGVASPDGLMIHSTPSKDRPAGRTARHTRASSPTMPRTSTSLPMAPSRCTASGSYRCPRPIQLTWLRTMPLACSE